MGTDVRLQEAPRRSRLVPSSLGGYCGSTDTLKAGSKFIGRLLRYERRLVVWELMYGFRKHRDAQCWFQVHWAATVVRETASRMGTDVWLQEAPTRSRLVPSSLGGY
ncbi:hypothetical protein J6590_047012 [Homalodisca vitripennis]|nr:hypothetical protein J6590_047012 [Homalodisca vitripennis]